MNTQSGLALPTALAFVVVTGVLIGTALLVGTMQRKLSSDSMRTVQAQYAASAGIEKAAQETFVKVLKNLKSGRTLIDYRKELDKIVLNGKKQEFEGTTLDKKESYKAIVEREDTAHSTILKITSRGWQMDKNTQYASSPKDATTRVLQQNLIIAPDQNVEGPAIFANEASCTACHTKVMDMSTFWTSNGGNTAPALDDKPLAKVVVTGDLTLLQDDFIGRGIKSLDEADLTIAGSLYLGGTLKNQTGISIPDHGIGDANQLIAFVERKSQSSIGKNIIFPPLTDCFGAACTAGASGRSFYVNYPLGDPKAADGAFPASPPLPFADDNHNKSIQSAEWSSLVTMDPGTLSGGNSDVYPLTVWSDGLATDSGRKYKDSKGADVSIMVYNAPTIAFSKTRQTLKPSDIVGGVISGSVVLDGTKKTLNISGNVFVNGDVVIFGKTSGQGKIFARGNIYVLGDLEYDCSGPCDYTKAATDKDFPMLTLAAGKNIVLGDIFARVGEYNNAQGLQDEKRVEPRYKEVMGSRIDFKSYGTYRNADDRDLIPPDAATWKMRENAYNARNSVDLEKDVFAASDPNFRFIFCADGDGSSCSWASRGKAWVAYYDGKVLSTKITPNPFLHDFGASDFYCLNDYGQQGSLFCAVQAEAVRLNFAATQLARFNQIEDSKTGMDYLPVYYRLYEDDTVAVKPVYSVYGKEMEPYLQYNQTGDNAIQPVGYLSSGTHSSLSPTGGWLTASDLRKMWNQNMETSTRKKAQDPMYPTRAKALQVDAILHASNAVVGFTRGNSRIETTSGAGTWGDRSSTGGRIMIQGAVVAQDIGILAPGDARDGKKDAISINRGRKSITTANAIRDDWYGLRINYDTRAAKIFVDPNTSTIKQLRRSGSRLVEFQ
ncbi:MAG: hypothetical protein U0Z75_08585 [Deinococcaceae bacterium]